MATSNKLGRHNNQHKKKNPTTIHHQDPKFLRGKPSKEKGKTTGPSPVKIFHYKIMSLQQSCLENTKSYKISKKQKKNKKQKISPSES